MSVPEATVHEDHGAPAGEDDIGLAGKISPVEAKTVAHSMD